MWRFHRTLLKPRATIVRRVYVPTKVRARSHKEELLHESSELDAKLKELKDQELELRRFLRQKREEETVKEIARHDASILDVHATKDDIAALEEGLNLGESLEKSMPSTSTQLPESILKKLPEQKSLDMYFGHKSLNWISHLSQLHDLKDVPVADAAKFVQLLDLKMPQNAHATPRVHELLQGAGYGKLPATINHNLMAGYATLGMPNEVEELSLTVPQNEVVFGHLVKAYFKAKDLSSVTQIIPRMKAAGLEPSLPIYTTVIQSFIQHKDVASAFSVFDNLKYLSTSTQPDAKLYNSLILAASKQHNVNKALDLYEEMSTRPIDPLEPNQETLNTLIYACARDPKTHVRAWELFLQLQRNFSADHNSMRALLYLCGETGELMLLRKLIAQLCANPETYPDDFALNCLFLGYVNYDPSKPSVVLATSLGPRIRDQIMNTSPTPPASDEWIPPFLPVSEELSNGLVIAESGAMIQFCYEKARDLLQVKSKSSASSSSPVIFNHLKIAIEKGTFENFQQRWYTFTKRPDLGDSVEVVDDAEQPHAMALTRNHNLYRLGLEACIKFRNLDFARTIWSERGKWRHSEAFKSRPADWKKKTDIAFARKMVELFAVCGQTEDALRLVESTSKQFRWRRHHLEPLLEVAAKQEDYDTILKAKGLLRRYYERERELTEFNEKRFKNRH